MKAIIPVAWYATRLFPLTENFPKALLEVWSKTMLDRVVEKVCALWITDITLVSNTKYFDHFQKRADSSSFAGVTLHVLNDWTLSNADRLWAIWDIMFALQDQHINEDILVIGGDNLLWFKLTDAYALFQKTSSPTIIAHDVQSLDLAKKYGIVSVDQDNRVTAFIEKPQNPTSTLAAICCYFYPKSTLPLFSTYQEHWKKISDPVLAQKRMDAPWNFPARLIDQWYDVYAQSHSESRYDVWSHEALEEARSEFGE